MSLSIGIVAEGITDQLVLQNILLGFFKETLSEQDIYFDQPPDRSLEEERYGSWAMVMTYLKQGRHRDVFQLRDYLVVQIDSDVSHLKHFDVSHTDPDTGKERSVTSLVAAIRERLGDWIGTADLQRYASRFLFAICVHETECWLVPLWEESRHHDATTNCTSRVQRGQRKQKVKQPINKNEPRSYDAASASYRKRKVLEAAAKSQVSLGLFLDELRQASTKP